MRLYWPTNLRAVSASISSTKNREWVYGIGLVLLVGVISVALTLQGWRSRAPAFDLLTYIYSIRNFLETGVLPQHGDTGSYGSYKPPGTAWLMLPSTILFQDPRLSEYAGTALLHFSTLLGLFLLGRNFFGNWCAYLAVLMYGLSETGIFMAGSLWPNGRPDFSIWTIFFASLWVIRREAKYLATALAIWAIGMHVDMGITPAFFIFPALWLYFKPPIRLKPLLFAGAIVLVVWSPYLRFEVGRGFADIRSQLLQQSIRPANYITSWCDPTLTLQALEDPSNPSPSGLVNPQTSPGGKPGLFNRLVRQGENAKDKILYNFQPVASIPGASYLLLFLTLTSLLILSVPGSSEEKNAPISQSRFRPSLIQLIAGGMILCGLILSASVLGFLLGGNAALRPISQQVDKLQKIFLAGGIALLVVPWMAATANDVLVRMGINVQTPAQAEKVRILVFSLIVPWAVLVLFAEPGKPERFWWLWPLQVLFLAAFLTNILPKLTASRAVLWISQVAIVLIVIGNPFLLSRVEAWIETGFSGQDAEEVQVVDYVANQIKAEGKDQAAIGYQTFIYPFMAIYNITNPVYKVGAEFDLFFRYRHGIVNTNQCAEGVAADDEYRIMQTRPKSPDWAPRNYVDVSPGERFTLLAQVGPYQVLRHHGSQ